MPVVGATIQYARSADLSNKLDDDGFFLIKKVTGTFLYYVRAVDRTIMVSLSAIESIQAAPTGATINKAKYFLDYAASHPANILSYSLSDMV